MYILAVRCCCRHRLAHVIRVLAASEGPSPPSGGTGPITAVSRCVAASQGVHLVRRQPATGPESQFATTDPYVAEHAVIHAREFRSIAAGAQLRLGPPTWLSPALRIGASANQIVGGLHR